MKHLCDSDTVTYIVFWLPIYLYQKLLDGVIILFVIFVSKFVMNM